MAIRVNQVRERYYHASHNKNFVVAICDNCYERLRKRLEYHQSFSAPQRDLDIPCDFCTKKKSLRDYA